MKKTGPKKEDRRYSILEYAGTAKRTFANMEEYENYIKHVKTVNSRTTIKYYGGNITKKEVDNGIEATVHVYNRLTLPRTISDIDEECKNYRSVGDMLDSGYRAGTRNENPDIYIGYFETKNSRDKKNKDADIRIKPLPLMFEQDQKYFEESYIKKCFIYFANSEDYKFFFNLCNEFCLSHDITEAISNIRITLDRVIHQGQDPKSLANEAFNLYKQYVYERSSDKRIIRDENGVPYKSHRRVRDIGSFIRDYGMRNDKRLSATRYNVPQAPKPMSKKLTEKHEQLSFFK